MWHNILGAPVTKFKVHRNRFQIFVGGAEGTANDIVALDRAQMAYFTII